jgi:hypothetical protein
MEISSYNNLVLVGMSELDTALAAMSEADITAETQEIFDTFRESTQALYDSRLSDPEARGRHDALRVSFGGPYAKIIIDSLRQMIERGRNPQITGAKAMITSYEHTQFAALMGSIEI